MVDIRLGGILPRLGWREGYELLDAEEHGTLQTTDPTSCVRNESDLYNVGALRRWERDPFLIVDPFIRIRVSVDKPFGIFILMDMCRM
jgi:hypothetical protein